MLAKEVLGNLGAAEHGLEKPVMGVVQV